MHVVLSPLISEKSMNEAGKGKFTFKVLKKADKGEIRREIEDKFSVNVVSIHTSIIKGKSRRFGAKRTEVALSSWKKATVVLKPGQKISIFDAAGANESLPLEEKPARKRKASKKEEEK